MSNRVQRAVSKMRLPRDMDGMDPGWAGWEKRVILMCYVSENHLRYLFSVDKYIKPNDKCECV